MTKKSSIWEAKDLESYAARHWPCSITRIGYPVSEFTRDSSEDFKGRYSMNDIFDSWDSYARYAEWLDYSSETDEGPDNFDNNFNNKLEKFYPPGKKSFDCPKNGIIYVEGIIASYDVHNPNALTDIFQRIELESNDINAFKESKKDNFITPIKFHNSTFTGFNIVEAHHYKDYADQRVIKMLSNSFRYQFSFDKLPPDATITIKIKKVAYKNQWWGPNTEPTFHVRFWTTSNKPITQRTSYKRSFGWGNSTSSFDIPIQLNTSFKPSDKVLYHCNAADKEAFVDDTFLFGFYAWVEASYQWQEYNDAYDSPRNKTYIKGSFDIEGELNVESPDPSDRTRRLIGPTLKKLNTTTTTGLIVGDQPDLKPGKITLIYNMSDLWKMINNNDPSDLEFVEDYKGLIINPLTPEMFPRIYLNGPKPNDALHFNVKGANSTLFILYEADCTKEQFENWAINIIVQNSEDAARQKKILDYFKVMLWAVNTDYLP